MGYRLVLFFILAVTWLSPVVGRDKHEDDFSKESLEFLSKQVEARESYFARMKRRACESLEIQCCYSPYFRFKDEISALRENLIAQHLALETALGSLVGHLSGDSRKPLVLSFHGWVGSGKTFLAQNIAKMLYRKGEDSNYYKFFRSSYDFPWKDEKDRRIYYKKIQDEVSDIVSRCRYSLIVFDEVDNMQEGVLDALTPFIDHPAIAGGVNYSKAIFILISNSGGPDITRITFDAWKAGRKRESLMLHDFENVIREDSFSPKVGKGGLYRSSMIQHSLVDFYIPFLPMERQHVELCVEQEVLRQAAYGIYTEKILDELQYWPPETPLFSTTGCKNIAGAVLLWRRRSGNTHETDEL